MISAPFFCVLVLLGVVWLAAIYDWRTMTIPNYYPLIVIALFLIIAPFVFDSLAAFGLQFLSFFIAFALGLILYVTGPMGGGDIKLFAALGFWITLPNILPWILCVTLSGLVLTIFIIMYRVGGLSRQQGLKASEAYKAVRVSEMPYGPAIAMGTTILFLINFQAFVR